MLILRLSKENNGKFCITNVNDKVLHFLKNLRVNKILNIVDDMDQVLNGVANPRIS